MIREGERWIDCAYYEMPPKHLDYVALVKKGELWRWAHCQCRHPDNRDVPELKRDCRYLIDAGRCHFCRQMDLFLGY